MYVKRLVLMLRVRAVNRPVYLTAMRLYKRRVIEAKAVGNVIFIETSNNRLDDSIHAGSDPD